MAGKRETYYVVQDATGKWKASTEMIWGAGHKFRKMQLATSAAEAIRLAKNHGGSYLNLKGI